MILPPRWQRFLRVPRPRHFLYFMSLRTGAEMIALTMLFNKITGFFGLLAVLTGLRLSTLQLAMYLYSCLALFVVARLMPNIRKQTPFHCLALAWFYLCDTVINTVFTAAFAMTWFLAVSADSGNQQLPSGAPGSSMMDDTAGFTSPAYNVTEVNVIAKPAANPITGQDAVAYGAAAEAAAGVLSGSPSLGHGVGIEESVPSLAVVVALTLVRVYFCLVLMSFARQVVRQHLMSVCATKNPDQNSHDDEPHHDVDASLEMGLEEMFAAGTARGAGWRGQLARRMLDTAGKNYWVGASSPVDLAWMRGIDGRFRSRRDDARPKSKHDPRMSRPVMDV